MDQLERAALNGHRVSVTRRGTEYVVLARRVEVSSGGERLIAVLPITGDEMAFDLAQIESFEVLP